MKAEGQITGNLCTDVKQLEQSQGSDGAVTVSHEYWSKIAGRKSEQSLFSAQDPIQPFYQSQMSADRPGIGVSCAGRRQLPAKEDQRGPHHPPLSIYLENSGSIIPQWFLFNKSRTNWKCGSSQVTPSTTKVGWRAYTNNAV